MSIQLTGESMQANNSNSSRGDEISFFKLKNNHDKAIVRLMHEDYNDFARRPVHRIKIEGREWTRGINCLRSDDQPESACPLCSCGYDYNIVSGRRKRIYIEFLVYKILDRDGRVIADYTDEPKRMAWEQTRKFDDKIFSLSGRYSPLCETVFQVERFGEAGSTDTSYDIYPIDVDKTKYPYKLPEETYNPDGMFLLDKSREEIMYYLENRSFPQRDSNEEVRVRADVADTPVQGEPTQTMQQMPFDIQPAPQQPAPQQPVQQPAQQQPVQQSTRRRRI